jgi:hypothetical protein
VHRLAKATYETPEQIEERIKQREEEVRLLPPGRARQSILIEISQLRMYALTKRWAAAPVQKPRAAQDDAR